MRFALATVQLCAAMAIFGIASACSRDTRDADTKTCIAAAQKQLATQQPPGEPLPSRDNEERHDRIGSLVAACMEQSGYRHDNSAMTDARCVDDVDYNPYCYRKRN